MKHISAIILFLAVTAPLLAQTPSKRESKKNLVVKEWNTDARTSTRWLDHVVKYDENGYKLEEIEYAQYGQKWRSTFEYGENGKIAMEVEYDEKDRPKVIRKYEYNSENRKVRQFNYSPNGKLQSTKIFEYIIDVE